MGPVNILKIILVGGGIVSAVLLTVPTLIIKATANRVSPSDSARSGQHKKIGKTECTQCHDALLKQKTVHPPAEGCDTCHEYSESGLTAEVKLTVAGNDLCLTCHTEKQAEMQTKKSKHPPAEDDCTACHDPHSSANPQMLKVPQSELCVTCHTEQQEEFDTKKFSHAPVRELGCTTCHNPHATDTTPLLKAEPNNVCLACHRLDTERDIQKESKSKLLIFPGTAIPFDYPRKAKKVILGRDGKGHPFIGHPVSGVADPSRKNAELGCVSCHNPHAGNYVQMFQKDLRGQALCLSCHK